MTAPELALRLAGKANGSGWVARCPAHDDERASLSIGAGDDGRVLLHCYAGCDLPTILGKLGVTERDLFPSRDGTVPAKPKIVAEYDYVDGAGTLLYQVVRLAPKDFRQRRPDGKDGWLWSLGDVARVLFRLPRVLATATAGGAVYIVEGEKDALALEALGLTATTNAGGAGKWRPDYAEHFRGCKGVVILPDNDDPGRKHAEDVARSLHAVGIPVKVLALPGLPAKGDVSDWLAAGGTKAGLLALGKAAPRWEPPAETEERRVTAEVTTRPPKRPKPEPKGRPLTLDDPEPWPDPVDGAEVLGELRETYARYLVLPVGADVILALWALHTYLTECFDHTAYLAICSPTKRSGKTTTIHVVKAHVHRALSADNVSPAALYRVIEEASPTLLIDELDRVSPDSDVWGILNSGHTRGGAVLRTVGETHEPRAFGTYCPKLVAYIRPARSPVPDTVEDRSIRIMLQRRGRGEQRERLRSRVLEATAEPIRRKLARWAEDHAALGEARPSIPEELDDRAADSWEPLLAIADEAGGDWPTLARELAIRFSSERAEEETDAPGVLVLVDLGALLVSGELVADDLGISGEACVNLLKGLPDRPWRTWGRKGDGLSERGLVRLLRPFDVRSEKVGPKQYRRMRYSEASLRAACDRFSPSVSGFASPTYPDTLTPPKIALVSNSIETGVRVSALVPDTEGATADPDAPKEEVFL